MSTAKMKPLPGILIPALLVIFILVSCQTPVTEPQKGEGYVSIPVPVDSSALGKINHFIPASRIDEFKKDFQGTRDSLARLYPTLSIPASEAFNKKALLELLQDSTNVGLRVYYGLKRSADGKRDEFRLMIVGVNGQGQDLFVTKDTVIGIAGKLAAKAPPPPPIQGGVEYGQCSPPCN